MCERVARRGAPIARNNVRVIGVTGVREEIRERERERARESRSEKGKNLTRAVPWKERERRLKVVGCCVKCHRYGNDVHVQ